MRDRELIPLFERNTLEPEILKTLMEIRNLLRGIAREMRVLVDE